MTYGIETYRPNGSVAMNGANKAGIFVKAITLWYGTQAGGSEVFNDIPAGSMFVVIAQAGGQYTPIVGDDGLGHAKLSWTYSPYGSGYFNNTSDTTFLVFARRVTQSSSYGILINNDDGDQLMDYTYPVPQYAGSVQPNAQATASYYSTDDMYQYNEHTAYINLRPGTNRLIMVNLPDSTQNDVWYSCRPFLKSGDSVYMGDGTYSTNVPVTLSILRRKGQPYQVPTLHVFSLDGPISGGGSYGLQYFKSDGSLVYDSSAENITIRDQKPLTYPSEWDAAQSMAINAPAQAGIVIPYLARSKYEAYGQNDINGNSGFYRNWLGMVQRRGNALFYQMKDTSHRLVYDPNRQGLNFDSQFGVPAGNSMMLVDLAQLGPSSVTGAATDSAYNY
jgi:hypothetical protein